jgi:hypothetical protein
MELDLLGLAARVCGLGLEGQGLLLVLLQGSLQVPVGALTRIACVLHHGIRVILPGCRAATVFRQHIRTRCAPLLWGLLIQVLI